MHATLPSRRLRAWVQDDGCPRFSIALAVFPGRSHSEDDRRTHAQAAEGLVDAGRRSTPHNNRMDGDEVNRASCETFGCSDYKPKPVHTRFIHLCGELLVLCGS
jgi:hypothetical protein